MADYNDMNGNPITEDDALSLPPGQVFTVTWDDGRSVECIVDRDGAWSVGHRSSGELKYYGAVAREDHMYRTVGVVHTKPQETFSAAARKYL